MTIEIEQEPTIRQYLVDDKQVLTGRCCRCKVEHGEEGPVALDHGAATFLCSSCTAYLSSLYGSRRRTQTEQNHCPDCNRSLPRGHYGRCGQCQGTRRRKMQKLLMQRRRKAKMRLC